MSRRYISPPTGRAAVRTWTVEAPITTPGLATSTAVQLSGDVASIQQPQQMQTEPGMQSIKQSTDVTTKKSVGGGGETRGGGAGRNVTTTVENTSSNFALPDKRSVQEVIGLAIDDNLDEIMSPYGHVISQEVLKLQKQGKVSTSTASKIPLYFMEYNVSPFVNAMKKSGSSDDRIYRSLATWAVEFAGGDAADYSTLVTHLLTLK